VDNAGDEVLNSYYSNHYTTDSDDPDVKNFIEAYKAKYNGEVPNSFAALGYDAAYMLADAITAAGSTDSVAVRDALAKTSKKFVTGQISFDEKHNPVKSAVIIQVVKGENGKLAAKYSTTINP
jgi:branched-chain amino acid transport system substrate-binding protein